MKVHYSFFFLFILGCATIKAPTGGPKDETPPRVVRSNPDSAQLQVQTQEIEIEFDEYIKTKDANNLLIITPNPSEPPDIQIKKKTLYIKFKDSLQKSTTYNIMINGAVIDVNEGNPLEDHQLTFSTGSFLDSLEYQAVIIDAFTKQACDHCAVFLYSELKNDSLLFLQRPQYLGKSSGTGLARVKFLPQDSFGVYAIFDENKNMSLDPGEMVSIKTLTYTGESSRDTLYIFPHFSDQTPVPKFNFQSHPGVIQFSFEQPYFKKNIKLYLKNSDEAEDSLSIPLYANSLRDTFTAYQSTLNIDTAILVIYVDSLRREYTYTPRKLAPAIKLGEYHAPEQGVIKIKTKQLIDSFDSSGVSILSDSILLSLDSFRITNSTITLYTEQKEKYLLVLNKGAITDINGTTNRADSAVIPVQKLESSTLSLKISLPDTVKYVMQVIKDDKVVFQESFDGVKDYKFSQFKPGNYRIKIIVDLNENGIWDPGNVLEGIPAEYVIISDNIELRPSWDIDLLINTL